jgi:hypothetical protein
MANVKECRLAIIDHRMCRFLWVQNGGCPARDERGAKNLFLPLGPL